MRGVKLALCALAAGCHAEVTLARPPAFERGVALGLFAAPEAGAEVDYEERLAEIRALGATDVSLVITWVQDDVSASTVRRDPLYTAPDELTARLTRRAHELGLRVMLFPILRLVHRTPKEWRGSIHPADLDQWFQSYGALLVDLAHLARAERVEVLSVGSELASTERRADHWEDLIARVRRAYAGELLYSANWDHYTKVPFWPSIDVVGISAYWGVAPPGEMPTVEGAEAAWRPHREKLAAFARRVGRRLVFTEVGYQSVRGAGAFPWNDFLDGKDGEEDAEAQRRLYEAFARAFTAEPALSGVYFWVWFGKGGLGDRGYTPRGKPAEYVLRAWYRAPESLPPPR
jgi:hypothetical protein